MKIDTDLRLAIRSAERAQSQPTYQQREEAVKQCIRELRGRKPSIGREFSKAIKQLIIAESMRKRACDALNAFGIGSDGKRIYDEDKFIKAGGKLPGPQKRPWKYDEVMKEMAAADPKKSSSILQRYGINWTE